MSASLQRASRAATVVRLAATVLVLVSAATCVRDQTTAPAWRTPPSVAVHGTYTALGTYSIQIVAILKAGEARVPVAEILKTHGFSRPTYFNWKSKYGVAFLVIARRLAAASGRRLAPRLQR